MKRILFALFVIAFANNLSAQKIGEIYDKNGIEGLVVKLASDGTPAVIMSLERSNERFYTEDKLRYPLNANNRNDGRKNMAAIEQYINQYGEEFPLYEWCKSLGEGWYLPAINEVYDAWINLFGNDDGKLDNYCEEQFLEIDKQVKKAGGDKLSWDKNTPRGMISSTVFKLEEEVDDDFVWYVHLKENTATSIASLIAPVRVKKNGKIESAYFPMSMKAGSVAVGRAFYRLKENAYEAGIYPAPDPTHLVFSDTDNESATSLKNVGDVEKSDTERESKKNSSTEKENKNTGNASEQSVSAKPEKTNSNHEPAKSEPVKSDAAAKKSVQPKVQKSTSNNGDYDLIVCQGEDIQCKVLKVGQKEIEYKRIDNPDGPTYTISRKKALKIKYANGYEEEVKISMFDFIKK